MMKTFTVIEYASFFALRHNATGEEHPMGDGVDTLLNADGEPYSPGTPGFVEIWQEIVDRDESIYMEAYFPHLMED